MESLVVNVILLTLGRMMSQVTSKYTMFLYKTLYEMGIKICSKKSYLKNTSLHTHKQLEKNAEKKKSNEDAEEEIST